MKVNYIKIEIKILIIVICAIMLSSCAFIRNCRYDTYAYFKPRLDKNPYVILNIRKKNVGIPQILKFNNYKVPDSVFVNYTDLDIKIYKTKGLYLIKIYKYIFDENKYSEAPFGSLAFKLIDTMLFDEKNKLEIKIEIEGKINYFNINLLKGRYIFINKKNEKESSLDYVQKVRW